MSGALVHNYSVECQVLGGNRQKWPSRSSILAVFHCFVCRASINLFQIVEYQLVVQEHIHIQRFLVHMTEKKAKFHQKSSKSAKIGKKSRRCPTLTYY